MKLVLFFLFYSFQVSLLEEAESYCSKDDQSCDQKKESYIAAHNKIFAQINKAMNSYDECNSQNCSCFLSTVKTDLKAFKTGITKDMIENVRKKGTTYVIHNKKLYRDKDCLFPARCSGIEYFIKQNIKKLPDLEMIVNTRDWPQIMQHYGVLGPVFSFSKTLDYHDIMFPAWSFWEGGPAISLYPTGLGKWDEHRKSLIQQSKLWPWKKKLIKGFFRGSRTSGERDALVLLSRKHPDIVDAQYTKNQAWKSSADTLGAEPAKEVSLEEHCQYKYLFNFRGVAASFRFKHLFLCGSLVIHFGDEWLEFFYPALKPWVHYIPMSQKASEGDILKMIEFLKTNDDVAEEIAERGRKFVVDQLTIKNVNCYWRILMRRYAKLLKYSVDVDPNLIEIK